MEDLTNVDVIIDDILVYVKDMNDHGKHLQIVKKRFKRAVLKLNTDRYLFRSDTLE